MIKLFLAVIAIHCVWSAPQGRPFLEYGLPAGSGTSQSRIRFNQLNPRVPSGPVYQPSEYLEQPKYEYYPGSFLAPISPPRVYRLQAAAPQVTYRVPEAPPPPPQVTYGAPAAPPPPPSLAYGAPEVAPAPQPAYEIPEAPPAPPPVIYGIPEAPPAPPPVIYGIPEAPAAPPPAAYEAPVAAYEAPVPAYEAPVAAYEAPVAAPAPPPAPPVLSYGAPPPAPPVLSYGAPPPAPPALSYGAPPPSPPVVSSSYYTYPPEQEENGSDIKETEILPAPEDFGSGEASLGSSLSPASVQPAPVPGPKPDSPPAAQVNIPPNTSIKIQDNRGQYSHGFKNPDGTEVEETGHLISTDNGWEYVIAKEGSYSYESPEGIPIKVRYIADEKGFRILSSSFAGR